MKLLLEEYGLAILSTVVIIIMIAFIFPLKEQTKGVLNDEAEIASHNVKYENEYTMMSQITEITTKINYERNTSDSVFRDFSDIANRLKDGDLKEAFVALGTTGSGFIKPFDNVGVNAGVWKYPDSYGGGVHLGVDYAVSYGTTINAPADGVIIVSSNGCEKGQLGDSCSGDDSRAVSYGGNQVFFITSVNSKVYVIAFSHLSYAKDIGVYKQGESLGTTGSSGNSTGSHAHVEVTYLGNGNFEDIEKTYLRTLYTSSFGCGWGESALTNVCDELSNGTNLSSGACRMSPELVFTGTESESTDKSILKKFEPINKTDEEETSQ